MNLPSINTVLGRASVMLDKQRTLTLTLGALAKYQAASGQNGLEVETFEQGAQLLAELCRAEDPEITAETLAPFVTILNLPTIGAAITSLGAESRSYFARHGGHSPNPGQN